MKNALKRFCIGAGTGAVASIALCVYIVATQQPFYQNIPQQAPWIIGGWALLFGILFLLSDDKS